MSDQAVKHFTLRMQFDGEQVSDVLLYSIKHDGKDAVTTEGRFTGVIQFNKGDTVGVEVVMTATENETAITGGEVISLDLVSVPNVSHTIESFSPFIVDEVTKSLKGCWSEPVKDTLNGVNRWITKWDGDPLTVVAEKGFWQLSGFLGAVVFESRGNVDGEAAELDVVRIPRVLSFDPEAGSGGDNPDPD